MEETRDSQTAFGVQQVTFVTPPADKTLNAAGWT
jgi:hypothetical protein